jgi:hypothetical protein
MPSIRTASLALAFSAISVSAAIAQTSLVDVMRRHGLDVKAGAFDVAFDGYASPTVPVTPGSFATPLAVLTSTTGKDQIDGAYAFGILAGPRGRACDPQEAAAAGRSLAEMIASNDRRSRVAGARVAGRLFSQPIGPDTLWNNAPPAIRDGLFAMLNRDSEIDQLAAMDALGLIGERDALTSLGERYGYYRQRNKRALAGGALEALARIGDPSTALILYQLAGDRWADGKDATALAVAFARERLLRDGSIAIIQQALNDKSRRAQARGYLLELGAPVP